MNPALNENMAVPQGSVQVMNVLDVPANNNTALEQLMTVDAGYLQGLPVSMLDWGASSTLFSVAVEIDDECVRALQASGTTSSRASIILVSQLLLSRRTTSTAAAQALRVACRCCPTTEEKRQGKRSGKSDEMASCIP